MAVDPYWDKVVLLLQFSNSGTDFTGVDKKNNATITKFNDVAQVANPAGFLSGGYCVSFDGNDLLTLPDVTNTSFLTKEFSIDFFVRFTSGWDAFNVYGLVAQAAGNNSQLAFQIYTYNGTLTLQLTEAGGAGYTLFQQSYSFVINKSYFISVQRRKSTPTDFIDFFIGIVGETALTLIGSVAMTSTYSVYDSPAAFSIGSPFPYTAGNTYLLKGYMDQIRVSVDVARGNIGIPTEPFPGAVLYKINGVVRDQYGVLSSKLVVVYTQSPISYVNEVFSSALDGSYEFVAEGGGTKRLTVYDEDIAGETLAISKGNIIPVAEDDPDEPVNFDFSTVVGTNTEIWSEES